VRGRPLAARALCVAACLTLSLVGVACGSGDDDKPAKSSTSSVVTDGGTSTTSVPGDPSASTTTSAAPAGPSTTARAGGPATTRAPAATTPPVTAPPGPVALTPAVPGTYRYATSGGLTYTGGSGTFPAVTTNRIDPPAGTRQHSTRDLKDASGNGSVVEYTFDYRPDGVYLVSLRLSAVVAGSSYPQELTPPAPLLFLATGAAQGASRTLTIPLGTAGSATVVVDVLGTERVTVAGQGIDTLVVRSAATLPPGDITGTQSLVVNIDPGTRLWVKERGVGDASGFGGAFSAHTQYEATLQSLTPG
jgi:hypothetical protein